MNLYSYLHVHINRKHILTCVLIFCQKCDLQTSSPQTFCVFILLGFFQSKILVSLLSLPFLLYLHLHILPKLLLPYALSLNFDSKRPFPYR